MGAVLTHPDRGSGSWEAEEFFATGRRQIADALGLVQEIGWELRHRRALDFGCGIGRLTQALCDHFAEAVGVDISGSMIEQGNGFNRHAEACRYIANAAPDLTVLGDRRFDFIYSTYVLQHIPRGLVHGYVREFVRVLSVEGLALFQVPTRRRARPVNARALRERFIRMKTGLEMFSVPRAMIEAWVAEGKGRIVAEIDSPPDEEHEGLLYAVAKQAGPLARPC